MTESYTIEREIEADALVTWAAPGWRRQESFALPHCFASDGVIWGLIGHRRGDKLHALRVDDVTALLKDEKSGFAGFLSEGVDGGTRIHRIKCADDLPPDPYWLDALAFLPDGRACRRLGRPLYRLSIARGSYLHVDLTLSSEPVEGKVWTSFGVDQANDLVGFSAALSSHVRSEVVVPALGDWPLPPEPTDARAFLTHVRRSVIREFPHEGLKRLPTEVVRGYADLLESDAEDVTIDAVLRIGNAMGVDHRARMKARKANSDDFNRPADRVTAIVELAYRRVLHFGLSQAAIDDEELEAAFG